MHTEISCLKRYPGLLVLIFFFSCSNSRMIETNLYFGQSRPDGSMITEAEWNDFKLNYICRVFKDGSSVTSLVGYWYDTAAHKMISEPSYMVTCDYRRSAAQSKMIDSLCYWYKQMFMQQSVLRVDKKVRAKFY